jgi:hypothetical protein
MEVGDEGWVWGVAEEGLDEEVGGAGGIDGHGGDLTAAGVGICALISTDSGGVRCTRHQEDTQQGQGGRPKAMSRAATLSL